MTKDIYDGGRMLPVMEEFYSLQGEGFHTGSAAYFLRIGGCDIGCRWCDSKESWKFGAHPLLSVDEVVARISSFPARAVVVTGGEPSLYPLEYLCSSLRKADVKTYLETSGAYPLTGEWDWICLSPKPQSPPLEDIFARAGELKVIIEKPSDLGWAEQNADRVGSGCMLYLQPEWSRKSQIMDVLIEYIGQNPRWRLSLQSHKYIGIP